MLCSMNAMELEQAGLIYAFLFLKSYPRLKHHGNK